MAIDAKQFWRPMLDREIDWKSQWGLANDAEAILLANIQTLIKELIEDIFKAVQLGRSIWGDDDQNPIANDSVLKLSSKYA